MRNTRELERQALELSQQVDTQKEAVLGTAIAGDFDLMALNILVDELNKVVRYFQLPAYPRFTESQDMLPAGLVQLLVMIRQAAMDAELAEYDFDLESITDNYGLTTLADTLAMLARDREFIRFLKSAPADIPEPPAPAASKKNVRDLKELL